MPIKNLAVLYSLKWFWKITIYSSPLRVKLSVAEQTKIILWVFSCRFVKRIVLVLKRYINWHSFLTRHQHCESEN
jgi:hypothetical protein